MIGCHAGYRWWRASPIFSCLVFYMDKMLVGGIEPPMN
jgi:hypothetical protein